ncbi:hypothetical protein CO229_01220 [Mycoplasmopsis bovirhinis]|uniref:HNH endonuclease n=1 Tax=Mycoplasmopsis bovirhinis TaxID=29553 RepID=UPI000C05BA7F|nr:HNH endonuclease domain-containing protein [Mycoplasmopsis bovirhinis]ATO30740.1 hypothetical protein CO229_01220 [Mycoplasmopsis bovirhinis]
MTINHESAIKFWIETYGKKTRILRFYRRRIVKAAYNDRNSNYGWNIDHIYPKSRGGTDNWDNLCICHILTNDEKSNKFPVFNSNNKTYQIENNNGRWQFRKLN